MFPIRAFAPTWLRNTGSGVPPKILLVGQGVSETLGTVPTPTPADDVTFAPDDFCLICVDQRTNANAITFNAPWVVRLARMATSTFSNGGFAIGSCRYGDATFGAGQWASASAAAGNCHLTVWRNVRLADPVGDFKAIYGESLTLNAPDLVLAAPGANEIVGIHYRRGTSASVSVAYPNAPLTPVSRISAADIGGNMAVGRSDGPALTPPTVGATMSGGTATRLMAALELKKVIS